VFVSEHSGEDDIDSGGKPNGIRERSDAGVMIGRCSASSTENVRSGAKAWVETGFGVQGCAKWLCAGNSQDGL